MIDAAGFVNHLCLFDFNVCRCSTFNRRYIKIYGPRPTWSPKVFEILLVKISSNFSPVEYSTENIQHIQNKRNFHH